MVGVNVALHGAICERFEGAMLEPCYVYSNHVFASPAFIGVYFSVCRLHDIADCYFNVGLVILFLFLFLFNNNDDDDDDDDNNNNNIKTQ